MTSPAVPSPTRQADAGRNRGAGTAALAAAVLVGAVFVWWVADQVGRQPPLPGRLQGDPLTTTLSALGDYAARVSAVLTLACFTGIVFFVRPDADGRLTAEGRRLARLGALAGQGWLWASLFGTFANSAYVNGVPLQYTMHPQAWWDFQRSTPSGLAWLLSAGVALGCVAVAYAARTVAPFVLALASGVLALAFVGVTGTVTVGLDHDWATDAATWLTLAIVPLLSAALAVLLLGDAPGPGGAARRVGRYHRAVPGLLAVAAAGTAVVAWQQLAGVPAPDVPYGRVALGLGACLALLFTNWAAREVAHRAGRPWRLWTVVPDGVLAVAYLALATAENHVPSPRFLVPQSIQINYLGYEVNDPVTLERLLGPGRPNWLWVGLSVAALAWYAVGVIRLRRQGRPWPVARTIAWTAGWLLTLYLATSGLWEYSTAVYSWHMVVHMTVNMLVPALCVLGGPFTLLRQAGRDRTGDLPGPREAAEAVGGFRPFWRLLSPPLLWLNYVGSLFFIYFTPLFPWLMRYHWAHQLMLLYFMVTGYAFFNLLIGVDRPRPDLPHLVRLALAISIMPFHAIFAVGIMSSKTLIGADFYQSIDVIWVGDLMADQSVAGQAAWILGEVPLFIVMISLAAQWFAHDKAENRRFDTAADTGADDSLDAYNDMLAQLAARDRDANRRRYL
nr:cytochrome c oxidase assembly protein [Propionibacterium sp.]